MEGDKKFHSFQQVKRHNTHGDCWLIISRKVYDLSTFMADHPGGDDVLISATGKDATSDFEGIGHSDSAREMMDKYCIGEIDASTMPKKNTYVPPQEYKFRTNKSSDSVIKILQFLVPLVILGIAFVARHYKTKKD